MSWIGCVCIIVYISTFQFASADDLVCNGMKDLCKLRIYQVTFPGTHNSGAGFDGIMKYHTVLGRFPASSCWYRSQQCNIYSQLEMGIRFFDIDTCWEDNGSKFPPKGAWTCHGGAYGGPIVKMLDQVDRWMNEPKNRNEVVIMLFNRDYEEENSEQIGQDIIRLLKERWEPTKQRLSEKRLTMQTQTNTRLGYAVKANRRITVIMHTRLQRNIRYRWLFTQYLVGYTWTGMAFVGSSGCYDLMTTVANKCEAQAASHLFVRLDLFLSWGLCIHDMASYCNQYIAEATNRCFKRMKHLRSTINFLVVDYADTESGSTVISAAKEQNIRNINYFLKKTK